MEIWKKWRDNIYISSYGNVCGRKKLHDNRGYCTISYKHKKYKLHRLVAELFIPNPENKYYVDHIDTNKNNNNINNLRWVTAKENSNNPLTIQHLKDGGIRSCKTYTQIICIETNEVFKSSRDAANAKKCNSGSIRMVLRGVNKTAGGYHWTKEIVPEKGNIYDSSRI